jgi:hypothetical protein
MTREAQVSSVVPLSGGGIERVFTSAGKQHDALKKNTMDKTLKKHIEERNQYQITDL